MLKINKILSKKIKFPLSLRGAKRRSNLNGFSLIELMVAITILAMAIFGIFHAYSVGFMGMADARDRTVATNYAREAMEDIKNMDFGQIITQSRAFISGTKYEREVVVQESTNLKKVTTNVYWYDRNGNPKMVETDMVVYFIETTAGDATKVILYADPYNVLTQNISDPENVDERKSTITAVIKDAKGNTVNTPDYVISFSITQTSESSAGVLSTNSETTVKGKATTTFTSTGEEGEVTITASATGLTSDSIIIKVTDPSKPVKINLTADPMFMSASTSSTSEITATIVDAGGATVTDATNEITFSVSGPGTLSSPNTLTPVNGVASVTLTSDGTPGTITITASASGLEPGVIDVITGGKIYLSASSTSVPVKETSVITVTTKDVNDVPVKYIGTIDLSIASTDGGSGALSSSSIIFNGDNSSETVTFTAASEGTVNVTAEDRAGILSSADPITLNITSVLVPDHIEVYASPSSIPAGGSETSTITAKVMTNDNTNTIVTSYTNDITFTTTAGSFSFDMDIKNITLSNGDGNYNDGIATVELYSSDISETALITVSSAVSESELITGSTTVGFYINPNHIKLNANPQRITVNGDRCVVTAKIVDEHDTVISSYNENITFTILEPEFLETIKFLTANTATLTLKVKKGVAIVSLKSGSSPGTARLEARSGGLFGSLNIPVGISLTLAASPNIYYNPNVPYYVSFDITIGGAPLELEEMQVSWDVGNPEETLDKIDIAGVTIYDNDSSVPVGTIVYTNNLNERVADIDVTNTTLLTGTSTIVMYFSGVISGKTTLDVTFNPNSGDYLVDLIP